MARRKATKQATELMTVYGCGLMMHRPIGAHSHRPLATVDVFELAEATGLPEDRKRPQTTADDRKQV